MEACDNRNSYKTVLTMAVGSWTSRAQVLPAVARCVVDAAVSSLVHAVQVLGSAADFHGTGGCGENGHIRK